jgi:two-component system response regulator CssR
MYTVYVVDDEEDLLLLLGRYLEKEEYIVKTFVSGEQAMAALGDDVHLWLLDIMLSGEINGFDLIKAIRERSDVPVIFMSARNQQLDRIMGLELGSDDYIAKPFSPRELVLRVNNVIKRVYNGVPENEIHYNLYRINPDRRTVYINDGLIDLTSKEMDLMLMLVQNKNRAYTREQILSAIWGDNYFGSDRVVDDLIKRLRKKMPDLDIETIYGYGYRLKP